jgi:hypothetical protein
MPVRTVLVLLVAGTTLAAARVASSATEPWDQDRVVALSRKLSTEVDAIDGFMRSRLIGDQNRADYYRLKETVRRIKSESARLAALLEGGAGHDETLPVFEQIGLQVRNGREIAKRMFTTTDLQMLLATARSTLDEIAPYYDAAPLPPPLQDG